MEITRCAQISGASHLTLVWNFLHVYLLALRLLISFLEFWKICVPLEIILGYCNLKYLSRQCSLLISTKCKAALFTIGWHMRGMETQLHSFLTSALDGYELSPSRSDRLPRKKKILGTHWMRFWVGPSAGLEVLEARKIPCSCRESKTFEMCWPVFAYSGYRDGSSQGEHDVSYLRLLLKPLI